MKIFPVVHYLDHELALSELDLARKEGADGAFLISHQGREEEVLAAAREARRIHPDWPLGINLLTRHAVVACKDALALGMDMVWADSMGVSSAGLDATGERLKQFAAEHQQIRLFASVAFKYQPRESLPAMAAQIAAESGFLPTTSGDATGVAACPLKTSEMAAAAGVLALASGVTAENLHEYSGHVTHALVSTGIAIDFHRMDPAKLRGLVSAARTLSTVS